MIGHLITLYMVMGLAFNQVIHQKAAFGRVNVTYMDTMQRQ